MNAPVKNTLLSISRLGATLAIMMHQPLCIVVLFPSSENRTVVSERAYDIKTILNQSCRSATTTFYCSTRNYSQQQFILKYRHDSQKTLDHSPNLFHREGHQFDMLNPKQPVTSYKSWQGNTKTNSQVKIYKLSVSD